MAVTKLCRLHQTYSVDEKIMERTETCGAPAFKNISKLGLSTPEADIQAQSVNGWQQEPLCCHLWISSLQKALWASSSSVFNAVLTVIPTLVS